MVSAFLVLVIMVLPSLPAVRRAQASLAWLGTLYFALIGLGFMFIEIGSIQRVSLFLGHPVYGLAIGLFSIILSTGFGSLISERLQLQLDAPQKLAAWAVSLCLFVVLLSVWFPALVSTFETQGLVVRVLVALAAIVPSGLLMGFGFPPGMRLVNAIDSRPTPMLGGSMERQGCARQAWRSAQALRFRSAPVCRLVGRAICCWRLSALYCCVTQEARTLAERRRPSRLIKAWPSTAGSTT